MNAYRYTATTTADVAAMLGVSRDHVYGLIADTPMRGVHRAFRNIGRGKRPTWAQPVHTFQRAWQRAGIDPRAWRRRSSHAIRKAFRSGLRHAGADSDATEAYMGHAGGLLDVYTDPRALPMLDLVERIPRIGEAGVDFQAARWGKRADG